MIEQIGTPLDWKSATTQDFPTLKSDDLHLWWLPLTLGKQESDAALTLLSDIQRDKYHRRMTPELKQAYLAGRYYLLTLLGLYTDCSADHVELSYSRLNKPYLSHKEINLEFNFTDTQYQNDHFGLFGFARAKAVGVDIESRHRKIELRKLIDRRFTQNERNYIIQADNAINKTRGLSVWTRKEAYGKATGQGINFQMNEQNLIGLVKTPAEQQQASLKPYNFEDKDAQKWRCLTVNLGDNFVASCVHAGHDALSLSAFNSLNFQSKLT